MNALRFLHLSSALLFITGGVSIGTFLPASQTFRQEIALHFGEEEGLPDDSGVSVICIDPQGIPMARGQESWFSFNGNRWAKSADRNPITIAVEKAPGLEPIIRKMAAEGEAIQQWISTPEAVYIVSRNKIIGAQNGRTTSLDWPVEIDIRQVAVDPASKELVIASSQGLWQRKGNSWKAIELIDQQDRAWATRDVPAVAITPKGILCVAAKSGVAMKPRDGDWEFFDGRNGLPWNEFTCMAAGLEGEIWFGTTRGAIRWQDGEWHYRQGPRWLPGDHVLSIAVDAMGNAWIATRGGVCCIRREPMTLARKAAFYEREIEQYIKRTALGYTAEADLDLPGDKSSANPHDSDNDGLWTSMYGAGECFAFAATGDPAAHDRARKAFEALRFLQKVTEGGEHSPPDGFVARTIRPTSLRDPNIGRLEHDFAQQAAGDQLWKVYEPRWPKSASGKWYWKSDTSSDELDGHYFFYAQYYDLCAETDEEKARVREVVASLTDHLLTHDFVLIDHDGRPTRWSVFGPQYLNRDPNWWVERGLNSLSIMSYLAVAAHITGDPRYTDACDDLAWNSGYAQNAMYPKVQNGPGSGNQSDDEMAFMCFYNFLQYGQEGKLKEQVRTSFYRYWINEYPEMNPFFNFAYAAQNLGASGRNAFGKYPLSPWPDWHSDAMKTLYGFPLDRLNWSHQNSHRLDIQFLGRQAAVDFVEPDSKARGFRINGKVLPIENRHFNHWNTDPWQLDYHGNGSVLASGTVFLLPYYMGLYHGFIELP